MSVSVLTDKRSHLPNPSSTLSTPVFESEHLFLPLKLKSTYTYGVVCLLKKRVLEGDAHRPRGGHVAVRDFRDLGLRTVIQKEEVSSQ